MKVKTKVLTSLLFFVLLVNVLFVGFSVGADAFGNQIWDVEIYQSGVKLEEIDADPTTTNYTISNYLNKWYLFDIQTKVNSSEVDFWIYDYQGIGIQIFAENDTAIYQTGVYPDPLRFLDSPSPLEFVTWETDEIYIQLSETMVQVNVSMWIYNSTSSSWAMTEDWEFNLISSNYSYTPPTDNNYFDFFIGIFVLSAFTFPLSIVGLIKLRNPKMVKVAVFALIGLICTFYIIMRIVPFS